MSESAVAAVTSGREASEQGDDTGSLLAGVLDNVKCCGCGALLHTSDKNSPGFVPNHIVEDVMSKYDESMSMGVDVRSARAEAVHSIICMRCHQLTFNGVAQGAMKGVIADDFRQALQTRFLVENERGAVVIKIVDILDFNATVFDDLMSVVGGQNPVILVANKFDLLPNGATIPRVRQWVKSQAKQMRLPIADAFVVCSKSGEGIPPLLRAAEELAERQDRDIYVLGITNVGKSTFINKLLDLSFIKGIGRGTRQIRPPNRKHHDDDRLVTQVIPVTSSVVAGTTLDLIPFSVRRPASQSKMRLFDTPGIYPNLPIHRHLSESEQTLISHKHRIVPITYRVELGQSLLLGALARIDHVGGPPFLFTTYVSSNVAIHRTKTTNVERLLKDRLQDILKIPSDPMQTVSFMSPQTFEVSGEGWKKSCADIVFDGLGWISLTGCDAVRVQAYSIGMARLRDPLMPYDAMRTSKRFTG
ncbi:NOA1/YqeH-like C-terminal domain-containing protein [Plasmodiophora brassicae]